MPETKVEPTVAVELDLPKSMIARLDALAAEKGQDRSAVVVELLREARPMTLAEAVAPIHADVLRSGMTGEEIDEFLEAELKAHREGR